MILFPRRIGPTTSSIPMAMTQGRDEIFHGNGNARGGIKLTCPARTLNIPSSVMVQRKHRPRRHTMTRLTSSSETLTLQTLPPWRGNNKAGDDADQISTRLRHAITYQLSQQGTSRRGAPSIMSELMRRVASTASQLPVVIYDYGHEGDACGYGSLAYC